MGKLLKPQPLTRAEKRAAALDGWVRRHVAESREAETAKRSRLKELRLAREALQKEPASSSEHADCAPGPAVRELVPERAQSDSGQTKKGDES